MLNRVLVLLSWLCVRSQGQLLDYERRTDQAVSSSGLCRYGNSVECCWGWRQMDRGRCQPYCEQGCKHGECVGPDRCKCHPGYTSKACNQDLNECGLKPRPCKHRCMNTLGSYKCYCLDGYTLQPDGSCRNTRTCYHANCQYGCEVIKGMVRCTCPSPGLQLGPDRRTCVDINECIAGGGGCPHRRKCVNTFGSFVCKCHLGFKLTYINGRYTCIDKDTRSFCSLNPSSPKCRCEDGNCKVAEVVSMPPVTQNSTSSSEEKFTKAPPKVTLEPYSPRTTSVTTQPITTTTPATTTTATTTLPTTTTTPTLETTTSATTTIRVTTTSAATTTTTPSTTATTTTPSTTATTTTPKTTPATTTTPSTTATTTTPATTPSATTTPATITKPTTPVTTPLQTTTSGSTSPITTTTATTPPPLTTTAPVTTIAVLPTTIATTIANTAAATTPSASTPATTTTTTSSIPITTTCGAITFTTSTPTSTASTTDSTLVPTTTEQDTTTSTPTITTTSSVALTNTMLTTVSLVTTTMNNRINKDVTQKQRGDVHIPRHPSYNQLLEFDIELGNSDDYARDDPKVGVLHCTFDHGVCDWMSDKEGDLHWETTHNSAGDSYLSVPELKAGQRSIRGARLGVQIAPPWSEGDVCFSFSHWLTGNRVGVLQLFVRTKGRGQRYSAALWSRTIGYGWRQTQVTLTTYSVDKVLLKAERRRGHRGQIAVDDITLRQGACR